MLAQFGQAMPLQKHFLTTDLAPSLLHSTNLSQLIPDYYQQLQITQNEIQTKICTANQLILLFPIFNHLKKRHQLKKILTPIQESAHIHSDKINDSNSAVGMHVGTKST